TEAEGTRMLYSAMLLHHDLLRGAGCGFPDAVPGRLQFRPAGLRPHAHQGTLPARRDRRKAAPAWLSRQAREKTAALLPPVPGQPGRPADQAAPRATQADRAGQGTVLRRPKGSELRAVLPAEGAVPTAAQIVPRRAELPLGKASRLPAMPRGNR